MKRGYGQRDVSNWTLIFDNNAQIYIDTVNSETITYYAGGDIEIIIRDCLIKPELLNLLRKGNVTTNVKRNYYLRNIENCEDEEYEDKFNNLVILFAETHGEIGEIQSVNLKLKTI